MGRRRGLWRHYRGLGTHTGAEEPLTAIAVLAVVLLVTAIHIWFMKPDLLVPLAIAAGILCSRPTFVGERYPWLGPTILMGSAAVALVVRGKSERRIAFWPVVLVLLAGAWSIVHEMLVPESEPNLWTTFLTFSLPLLSFHFIARD